MDRELTFFYISLSVVAGLEVNPFDCLGPEAKSAIPAQQVDYYAVLGVERDATPEQITRAWRRLVLLHHPDKRGSAAVQPGHGDDDDDDAELPAQLAKGDIRLINEARFVLSDPARRRAWEEDYKGVDPASVSLTTRTDPHIFREVSLELFEPHSNTAAASTAAGADSSPQHNADPAAIQPAEELEDDEPLYYTYPCRCSAEFCITRDDLENGVDVIGCEGCGEWIRVGYEVVDDEA